MRRARERREELISLFVPTTISYYAVVVELVPIEMDYCGAVMPEYLSSDTSRRRFSSESPRSRYQVSR